MRQLYVIAKEIDELLWDIESDDGELPPELEQKLNALSGDFDEKIERCLAAWTELEHTAEIQKAESKRLADLARRTQKEADWLKEYVKRHMVAMRKTEHRGPLFPSRVCSANPSVVIFDEKKVPEDYWVVTELRKVNKRELLEDLKTGIPVPGCNLVTDKTYLRIGKAKKEEEAQNDNR